MAYVDEDEVRRLAQLSSISLSDDQRKALQEDLGNILNYIEQLKAIDTTNIEPTYQVTGLENVEREDEIIDYGLSRDDLLANAPDKQDDQIKVPKVL